MAQFHPSILVLILAAFLLVALIWLNIREYYGLRLDEIYDQHGRRQLILWYNVFTEDNVKREYKILCNL